MAVRADYLAYVLEQLSGVRGLRSHRMFGGVGLYGDDLFFGLIDDDTLYFKTGDRNVAAYLARGMRKFMPFPDRPEAVMGYHEVPADVIEDAESLAQWAHESLAVAAESRGRKQRRAKPPRVKPARKAKRKPGTGAKTRSRKGS